jgi:CBS domain-containing membrane protein
MNAIRVGDIMTKQVVALQYDHSVHLASSLMHMKHIRHLPVIDASSQLVGIVTHRDLVGAQAHLLARGDRESLSVPVAQVMRTQVWSVHPDTPVLEAARIMHDHKFGCLPVLDGRRVVGIVTEADLLATLLKLLETRRDREDTDPRLRLDGG